MKKVLIVGLGNIGSKYKNTRHNIGFNVIDKICKILKLKTLFIKQKFGLINSCFFKNIYWFLLKPTVYMNNSGLSILYFIKIYNIKLSNVFIIVDDLNRKLGDLKIKPKGGHGGHNGLKNIQETLNTKVYHRLYVGINNNTMNYNRKTYVLEHWTQKEFLIIMKTISLAAYASIFCGLKDINFAMNNFNFYCKKSNLKNKLKHYLMKT